MGGALSFAHNPRSPPCHRGRWMFEQMKLSSEFFGTPLVKPQEFPFNTFPLQCLLRIIKDKHSSAVLEEATEHFYMRVWGEGKAVRTPEEIKAELNEIAKSGNLGGEKLDVEALLEEAGRKETRTRVNEEAKRIVDEGGAFGAPWIVTTRGSDGKSMHWFGSDRQEQIAHWLNLPYKGPLAGTSTSQQPKL